MKFKTKTTHTVHPDTKLDQILLNGLPVNSFFHKGRCAIGGTYSEITNKNRCTIITVSNISIALCKQDAHPEIDIVYGKVSLEEVIDMLAVKKPGHKIMTTPEGIWKIMKAAELTNRLEEIYNEWFLLLDESHTFISEHYREGILKPFEYFWNFKQKSIISATPFIFSDTKFEELDYHEITFTEPLGTVHLVNAISIEGALNQLLKNRNDFPGNLHIYYNSVTEIKKAIERAGLEDCNIFCADDKDHKNKKKLGDLWKHFVPEPKIGGYKKVNFYTTKYFEGWDLYDDNATMVLVTDVRKEHTKVGVGSKGKQAIGRLRVPVNQIIHITNHNNNKNKKPLEAIRKDYRLQAQLLIKQNDEHLAFCNDNGSKYEEDIRVLKFADIDKINKVATLNLNKLDQQINEAANNEIYNHIDYIEQDWKDNYYHVVRDFSDHKLETPNVIKRKSTAKQLEEDYLNIMSYRERQQQGMIYSLGKSPEQQVRDTNPTAYFAAKYLNKATMQKLKYNVKEVEKAIILKESNLAEVKLLKLLPYKFKTGKSYTNDFIKSTLQELYNRLEIKDSKTGKIRVATASQLGENGRFEIDSCKIKDKNNKEYEHGKFIKRAQFGLKMAA